MSSLMTPRLRRQISNLKTQWELCVKRISNQREDGWDHPTEWTPESPTPTVGIATNVAVNYSSMANWRLRAAPENPGWITADRWVDEEDDVIIDWTSSRLTDAAVIFIILTMDYKERARIFIWDFDAKGEPTADPGPVWTNGYSETE